MARLPQTFGLALLAILLAPSDAAFAADACATETSTQTAIDKERRVMETNPASAETSNRNIEALQRKLATAHVECEDQRTKERKAEETCNAKASATNPDGSKVIWKWDAESKTCEDQSQTGGKSTSNSGDCNNAEYFKGGLRGQACKETATTVKDVTSQNEALTASTTALTTVYSSAQSMQATGAQADSQDRQKKIMQALAISKIATGGLALTNAARLKSAASDAEGASSSISSAQKQLSDVCDQQAALPDRNARLTTDQCFYKYAAQYGVDPTEAQRANFDRMRSGATQSQEQADRANNLAATAMVQGMADALVGVQALQLANQAQQNAAQAGTIPQVVAMAPTQLRGSSGGSMGGFGSTEGAGAPVDYGVSSDGGTGLGGNTGEFHNGIQEGKSFGRPSGGASPARSSVTTGGAGSAGGGAGGGGGGAAGKGGKGGKGGSKDIGEYTIGGNLGGPRGGGGGGGEKADGANPFADALAKLFPKDAAGKPVVDTRELASAENPGMYDDAITGANDIIAADLSLFEQVTAKYRQLNSNGRL